MALFSSINFLPAVFRSPTNQRFLGATMDQLASDAVNTPLNGYIGRKFAPTYRNGDNFVPELDTDRQNYQLEASVVVTDNKKNVKFNANHLDLLNSIKANGGLTNNQQRLFTSESYTYDGRFNYDKFVNYYNYYWLPNGPASVSVTSQVAATGSNYIVTRNTAVGGYVFGSHGPQPNLPLTLVRGGTYTFTINQPGFKFWIQSEPGTSGLDPSIGTVTTREIFGVTNNGTDNGVITFNVPQSTAQDFYATLPTVASVDIAVNDFKYSDLHNVSLSSFLAAHPLGLDGINNQLHGLKLIFVNNLTDTASWTVSGTTVPTNNRTGIWQISLLPTGTDYIIRLVPLTVINSLEKVFIQSGSTYASHQFWLDNRHQYSLVPNNTAILDYLYYQDSANSNFIGVIKIVDNISSVIDVTKDILGFSGYVSPNGVKFTNGLKIKFDSAVIPAQYANNEYYVDGVGTEIDLVPVSEMVVPESYSYNLGIMPSTPVASITAGSSYTILSVGTTDFTSIGASKNEIGTNFIATAAGTGTGTVTKLVLPGTITPDYITINRSSQDLNSWSRSNRWFHADVIAAVATYNNTTPDYGPNLTGRRPIIEFDPNMQLFNHGQVAGKNITYVTFAATDAFVQVEGQVSYSLEGYPLKTGDRVVFANDYDKSIINKIWEVQIQIINNTNYITLVATADDPVLAGQNFLVTSGVYAGQTFYYNGTAWNQCQVKYTANQPPLFDLVDKDGFSFSNQTVYPATTFAGCKLFGYNLPYITANAIVSGSTYKITSSGTTNFTLIGSANNHYGTTFTANAAGTGTGTVVSTVNADKILGFPLTYETFNNIGDILFDNYYDTASFSYTLNRSTTTVNCSTGYIVVNSGINNPTKVTNWITNLEKSDQDQIFTTFYEGKVILINGVETAFVQIDVLPAPSATVPSLKIFLNNVILTPNVDYQVIQYGVYNLVTLTNIPALGDKIDVEIFSNEQSQIGYYEVPENLDLNALNENFNTITLGQLRNHYNKLIENSAISTTGTIPLRDRYLKKQGGTLNQHQAPTIYAMTFLNDSTANFISGLNLARKEYAKFKNKFLSLCSTMSTLNHSDPVSGVDAILQNINGLKNNTFPWYYSDMVPYGGTYSTTTYHVINARQTQYEINSIFNNAVLGNRAVLVYVNGVQQTVGIDYTFSSLVPAVQFLRSFVIGDVITIKDYPDTDGNYIPETPTKLGLYPKSVPEIDLDNTYQTPINVIRGHDGSLTPAFGDFRDQYLLELERRIYNNIKTQYDLTRIDLDEVVPGRFRANDYTLDEYNSVMAQNFLEWAGTYNVNYTENPGYDANDPWTWNYSQFTDVVDGSFLQGYWREIYEYWYDTSTPHLTPWKMVGFSSMPSWWVARYGPAPYTRGNSLLWEDLQNGVKWNNGTPITDPAFARPGLTNFIPVDTAGNLLDPTAIPLVKQRNPQTAGSPFQVGHGGPAETAWRRSSDYPFSMQLLMALTKPARYFATQFDTSRFYTNPITGQFTDVNNRKITPTLLTVNGATTNGVVARTSGYINWVADYIKNLGIDPGTVLYDYFNNFSVRLNYKVAGFTDHRILTVTAEQTTPSSTGSSVIIPDNNFQIYLNKSVPVATATYSAVIVEKTITGYAVSGYGLSSPYFTIIPSIANKNATPLTLNELTVQLYNDAAVGTQAIPYGTEFSTVGQVADFLISYQRYLESQGFLFNQFNSDLNEQQNWTLSVKELMYWSQQGWAPGTTIILNPIGTELRLTSTNSVVDQITNTSNGNRLLDENFNPIKSNDSNVVRIDNPTSNNLFVVTSLSGATIAYAKLHLIQYEHVLIFDNVDDFGDIIYIPNQGTRQFRLKLTGAKTGLWDGSISATGYIYNNPNISAWAPGVDYKLGDLVAYNNFYYAATQNLPATTTFNSLQWSPVTPDELQTGLLPSFGLNAQEFNNFYDVDNPPQDSNFLRYSSGLIGFRQRQYLTDLGISVPTQTKFYQGLIKEKGSMNAITALTRANFNNIGGNVNVYEEWAFRVGTYGSVNSTQYKEFILDESVFNVSPITVSLGNVYSKSNAIVTFTNGNVYRTSNLTGNTTTIYSNRVASSYIDDLPSVGFVNIDDIDFTDFNIATPTIHAANISIGSKVWTAKNTTGQWGIYRASETNITATSLTNLFDLSAKLIFSGTHSFQAKDVLVLKNFNSLYDGIYTVVSVIDTTSVEITISSTSSAAFQQLFKTVNVTGSGTVYKLANAYFDTFAIAANSAPLNGWINNDRVWVANTGVGTWGVYTYSNVGPTWTLTRSEQPIVDIDSISRTLMYNKTENRLLAALDYIDPAKGKVLSAADKNIDYKLESDPALYNAGTVSLVTDLNWGAEEVGSIWWDLSTIRYINYEQDSLTYRMSHWGTQFPGSSVDIYQWVESSVKPSQYVANGGLGTPKYPNDSAYCTYGYVNPSTGILNIRYYFWVKNLITTAPGKTSSVLNIASMIASPQSTDIPYAEILRNDSVALYNVNNLLVGQNTVLQLGSRNTTQNRISDIIHSEYTLVQENNPNSIIPPAILTKLADSLSGIDQFGNAVPDVTLPISEAYGVSNRPLQSMIMNRPLALKNAIAILNPILLSYPIVENKITTLLNSGEPKPSSSTYSLVVNTVDQLNYIDTAPLSVGYAVLVNSDSTNNGKWAIYTLNASKQFIVSRVQSYLTPLYWSYADWYSSSFNPTTVPDITVANRLEYGKLTLTADTHVKILNNGNNKFVVYYIDSNLKENLVGIESGTIQISTGVIPSVELRQILVAIQTDILIDDLAIEFNKFFFSIIKYILTEQKNLDWVFKTSFINATQSIRKLQEFPAYVPDNQNFYLDYINEVKPYRTKIREFVVDYIGNDSFSGDVTDFDLQPYWDANLQVYRSPNGSQPYDAALWSNPTSVYSQWYNFNQYDVVGVTMQRNGTGYIIPPTITFVGGGGAGAEGYATINGTGQVTGVVITKSGEGYTSQPTVVFNGTGTGAVGYVILRQRYIKGNISDSYNLARSISTVVKFDRTTYTNPNVFVQWANISTANIGQVISSNVILVLDSKLYQLANTYTITGNITTGVVDFPFANVTQISASTLSTATDRITAFKGNIDLNVIDGVGYTGVIVNGNTFVTPNIDTVIFSKYTDPFGINPSDILLDGGKYYDTYNSHAPQELIPGRTYDSVSIGVHDTQHIAFRNFTDGAGTNYFTRVPSANTTTLSSSLLLTDNVVHVTDALRLPPASAASRIPGVMYVNGERITYFRNYAWEPVTAWTSNAIIATDTLISYSGNTYLTLGNVYGQSFSNVAANVSLIDVNSVAQIRRGVDRTTPTSLPYRGEWTPNTAIAVHSLMTHNGNTYVTIGNVYGTTFASISSNMQAVSFTPGIPSTYIIQPIGSKVIDTSVAQAIPYTTPNVITLTSNTAFNSADATSMSYRLQIFGNLTASAGDIMYQFDANLNLAATLKVLESVTNTNLLPVIIITGHLLGLPEQYDHQPYDHLTFSTISAPLQISALGIGNIVVSNSYVVSGTLLGMLDANGVANVAAGTKLKTDTAWYNLGTSTPSDGAGLVNSTTIQAKFLKDSLGE